MGGTGGVVSWLAEQLAFARIGTEDRPKAVAQRITQAISVGLLPPGTVLPSEVELARQLGVSTITLRAALAELRAQGYLETQRGRGRGSYIRIPADGGASTAHARLAELDLEDLRDLRDYHTSLAGAEAALAAQRARGEVLDRLGRLGRAVTAQGDPFALARADSRFHIEIAASTRSTRLAHAELEAQAEIGLLLWLLDLETAVPQRAAAEHNQIVAALTAGDPGSARELAEAHVQEALNALIQVRMDMSVRR